MMGVDEVVGWEDAKQAVLWDRHVPNNNFTLGKHTTASQVEVYVILSVANTDVASTTKQKKKIKTRCRYFQRADHNKES